MDILRGIFLPKNHQMLVICIIISFFIYFRKLEYYKVMPRENLLVAVLIGIWSYVCLKISPWFVIAGLVVLNILNKIM